MHYKRGRTRGVTSLQEHYHALIFLKFIKAGLVNIHKIDESIRADLVNSDPDKIYFRENYSGGLDKAYLQKEVALKLLSEVMKQSGYIPLSHEWWHFDGMPKDKAQNSFKIIE